MVNGESFLKHFYYKILKYTGNVETNVANDQILPLNFVLSSFLY